MFGLNNKEGIMRTDEVFANLKKRIEQGGVTDETIKKIVEQYLEKNPVQVITDNTLSVAGTPADALATGTAIDSLKEDLDKIAPAIGTHAVSEIEDITQGTTYQNRTMIENIKIPHGTKLYVKITADGIKTASLTANSSESRVGKIICSINKFNEWVEITLESRYFVEEYDPYAIALGLNISGANVVSSGTINLEIVYGALKELEDIKKNVDILSPKVSELEKYIKTISSTETKSQVGTTGVCFKGIEFPVKAGETYGVSVSIDSEDIKGYIILMSSNKPSVSSGDKIEQFSSALSSGDYIEITPTLDAPYLNITFQATQGTATITVYQYITLDIKNLKNRIENSETRLNDAEIIDANYAEINMIPEYYTQQINEKLDRIHELERKTAYGGEEYIFITDTHILDNNRKSPGLLKFLLENTNSNRVLFGGDMIKNYGTQDEMYKQAYTWNNLWGKAVVGYEGLYNCRGNHDVTRRTSGTDNTGYTVANSGVYAMMLRKNALNISQDLSSENPLYYYFENKKQKIRYIVLDSTERGPQKTDVELPWHNGVGISPTQLNWLIAKVKELNDDWSVIIMSHIGMTKNVLTANYDPAIYYEPVLGVIEAMAQKKSYSFSGKVSGLSVYNYEINEDFSSLKANVLYIRNGHDHRDNYDFTGVWEIGSIADAAYPYDDSFLGGKHARTAGTVEEQALDVDIVDIEDGMLYCNRIGSGYDRTFHLEKMQISTSVVLIPTISTNNFAWKSLNENVVTVNDGVLSPISNGYTAIEAMDNSTGEKEMWAIEVVIN